MGNTDVELSTREVIQIAVGSVMFGGLLVLFLITQLWDFDTQTKPIAVFPSSSELGAYILEYDNGDTEILHVDGSRGPTGASIPQPEKDK